MDSGMNITNVTNTSDMNVITTSDMNVTTYAVTSEPLFFCDSKTYRIGINNDGTGPKINNDVARPKIKKVDIIYGNSGEERGVKVTFEDGDVQKSICSAQDTFCLETGISVCLTKHLLKRDGFENASAAYNNTIRKAVKIYEKDTAKRRKEEEKVKLLQERKKKVADKKRLREERKKNAEREYQISVQKEAYIRAFRELQNERLGDLK